MIITSKEYTDEPFAPGELEEEFHKEKMISENEQDILELLSHEYIERQADKIMKTNPVKYFLKVFQNQGGHVGDRHVAKLLLLSILSQSISNSKGINVSVIGRRSGGKTECCKTLLHLIPEGYKQQTKLTDKAIWRVKTWNPKTIIFSNDVKLNEQMEEVIKRSTDAFQTGDETYTPLNAKREPEVLKIPAKLTWWLTSVDASKNEQLMSRFITVRIDESEEQDDEVHRNQMGSEDNPLQETTEVKICREIILKIKKHGYLNVHLEKEFMVHNVEWKDDKADRRRFPMFKNMIRAFAVLRHKRRHKDKKGRIVAILDDFESAAELYNEIRGITILEDVEEDVWRVIYEQALESKLYNQELKKKLKSKSYKEEIKRTVEEKRPKYRGIYSSPVLIAEHLKKKNPETSGAAWVRKIIKRLEKKLPPGFIKMINEKPPLGGRAYYYTSSVPPTSKLELVKIHPFPRVPKSWIEESIPR